MLAFIRLTNRLAIGIRLAIAFLALALAHVIQIPFDTYIAGEPFLLFFAVVISATIILGRSVGFLTLVASSLLSSLFFEPHLLLRVSNAADLLAIEVYTLLGAACVLTISQLMRSILAAYDRIAALERRNALLLSEMAHRVANNFATVSALIRRKAAAMSDPGARSALDAAIEQVNVMARVHARLRSEEKDLVVRSRQFFDELCDDLNGTIPADRPITLERAVIDHPLPLAQAVLLGLILNELITNAIKYAFCDGRSGTIRVCLQAAGDDLLCLSVADNGVGAQGPGPSHPKGSGQGRELIAGLSQQLGAKIETQVVAEGTCVRVFFPRLRPQPPVGKPDPSPEGTCSPPDREPPSRRPEALSAVTQRGSLH